MSVKSLSPVFDGASRAVRNGARAPREPGNVDMRGSRVSTAPPMEGAPAADSREMPELEGLKRRMPDNLRRFLIRMQGGKAYLPAAYRIVWFRDELGDDWGVRTEVVEGGHQAGFATVHAEVLNPDGRVIASGHKTESKSDFPAGWVEKAESGAIARALALMGFGTQFSPELDDDGYRPADSPQPRFAGSPSRFQSEPQGNMAATVTPRGSVPASAPESDSPRRQAHSEVKDVATQTGIDKGLMETKVEESESGGAAKQNLEVWSGPGLCSKCHAPEGKRHGRQCLA